MRHSAPRDHRWALYDRCLSYWRGLWSDGSWQDDAIFLGQRGVHSGSKVRPMPHWRKQGWKAFLVMDRIMLWIWPFYLALNDIELHSLPGAHHSATVDKSYVEVFWWGVTSIERAKKARFSITVDEVYLACGLESSISTRVKLLLTVKVWECYCTRNLWGIGKVSYTIERIQRKLGSLWIFLTPPNPCVSATVIRSFTITI